MLLGLALQTKKDMEPLENSVALNTALAHSGNLAGILILQGPKEHERSGESLLQPPESCYELVYLEHATSYFFNGGKTHPQVRYHGKAVQGCTRLGTGHAQRWSWRFGYSDSALLPLRHTDHLTSVSLTHRHDHRHEDATF